MQNDRFHLSLIRSLEQFSIPDGDTEGDPFVVLPYQKRFLRGAYKAGVFRAAFTAGRGSGKTGLLSALAADSVHPEGALHRKRGETVLIASSLAQASIGFEGALTMLEERGGLDKKKYRVVQSNNMLQVQNRDSGARVRCASSDHKRAHGWRVSTVLADEPSQWSAQGEALNAAIVTSLGKRKNSKVLYFGTRPRRSDHWFERTLQIIDRSVFILAYQTARNANPYLKRNWHMANPGLKYGLPDIAALEAEARLARLDPGLMASFRALRLNQGVSDSSDRDMLVDPAHWERLLERQPMDRKGQATWGVDLGGAQAMSAISAVWQNGRLECMGMFGNAIPLEEREVADGADGLYTRANAANELVLSGQRIPDIQELFRIGVSRFGGMPSRIVCDRWRVQELYDALDGSEYNWRTVEVIPRGQGFQDGSHAVRAWRNAVTSMQLYPVPSMLLTAAIAEAVTMTDPAGNEKLAKGSEAGRRLRAKDDVVAAALLGVEFGLGEVHQSKYGGLV